MKMKNGLLAAAVAAALVPGVAGATAGFYGIAQGAKAMGIAGAVTALPQDTIGAAVNPAGMASIGDGADFDVRFFSPIRNASLDPRAIGGTFEVDDQSSRELFVFPHFGYYKQINSNLTLGITGYSNGGMNSNYDRNIFDETNAVVGAFLFGVPPFVGPGGPGDAALVPEGTGTGAPDTGTLGIDFGQVTMAPTLAYQFHEDHSVGLSLLIGVQRLSARGLGNFQCFTQSATCGAFGTVLTPSTKLTNNGSEWSYGAGVRVGWMGQVHPRINLGAAVASKIYMTEFDDYEDLLAEDGDLDTPPSVSVGAAFQLTPKLTLATDYQRIFYEEVDSISNDGPTAADFIAVGGGMPISRPLGSSNGLGFGWKDINVFKVGLLYEHSPKWTFRAGYHYNESPIRDSQILFNILAPAVVQHHATAGFSYKFGNDDELSVAYMHAFEEEQSDITPFGGLNLIPGEIEMYQNSLDIQYSWKF